MFFKLASSQSSTEEMETAPSPPPAVAHPALAAHPSAGHQAVRPALANSSAPENTITNICASNIILDVPEMTTRSRTGANKASGPPAQTITKIIIPKHILQGGGQVVTVLPGGGVHALQPALVVSSAPRQPPPLQQMQSAPPPPRLQQMALAPPPLQAKPREGSAPAGPPASVPVAPPPPLQIKIIPATIQDKGTAPAVVAGAAGAAASAQSLQRVNSDPPCTPDEDVVAEVLHSEEVNVAAAIFVLFLRK